MRPEPGRVDLRLKSRRAGLGSGWIRRRCWGRIFSGSRSIRCRLGIEASANPSTSVFQRQSIRRPFVPYTAPTSEPKRARAPPPRAMARECSVAGRSLLRRAAGRDEIATPQRFLQGGPSRAGQGAHARAAEGAAPWADDGPQGRQLMDSPRGVPLRRAPGNTNRPMVASKATPSATRAAMAAAICEGTCGGAAPIHPPFGIAPTSRSARAGLGSRSTSRSSRPGVEPKSTSEVDLKPRPRIDLESIRAGFALHSRSNRKRLEADSRSSSRSSRGRFEADSRSIRGRSEGRIELGSRSMFEAELGRLRGRLGVNSGSTRCRLGVDSGST